MSPHNHVHRQRLDSTHVRIVAEKFEQSQGDYVIAADITAVHYDCGLPIIGQGVISAQDPDSSFVIGGKPGHFQRVSVLTAQEALLLRMTYTNSTVSTYRGPVVTGAVHIKPWSTVRIVTVRSGPMPDEYRVSDGSPATDQFNVVAANHEELIKEITRQWRAKHPNGP